MTTITAKNKYDEIEWTMNVLGHLRTVCNAKAHQRADKAELAAARLLAMLDCEHIIDRARADLIEAAEIEKED
jgi:hypothetical protein